MDNYPQCRQFRRYRRQDRRHLLYRHRHYRPGLHWGLQGNCPIHRAHRHRHRRRHQKTLPHPGRQSPHLPELQMGRIEIPDEIRCLLNRLNPFPRAMHLKQNRMRSVSFRHRCPSTGLRDKPGNRPLNPRIR